jgi:pimeloyl-ACP methyl ester carboxylesterase
MKNKPRRIFSVAVVGVVAAATVASLGASASASVSSTSASVASIAWGACTEQDLIDAGGQCGLVAVPLDYAHPNGTKIQIAVSRIPHTSPDSQYQGVMLVNPGGPGGSGLGLATLGEFVPGDSASTYDWIGFDPRGVGSSQPAISCDVNVFNGPRPPYVPTTAALERTWLARSKAYADACAANNGPILRHMTTEEAARDMDSIRAALGVRQINYYGFSYGTYLGQVYASLFPNRVRRMVLDSNVDPRDVWYQANLNQDLAFQKTITIWFGWLAKYDSVYHLGKTEKQVETLFYKEEAALKTAPAGGVVGPDEWDDIFLLAGYYQFFWLDLADAFAGWVHNADADTLVGWYQTADGPGDDNGYAVYLAVQCTDTQWPTSWAKVRRDNWATFAKAPFETWGNAWFNGPCSYWPAPARTPVRIDGKRVPGILLVDETLDAATPFPGSLEVRKLFPNSSLIAEPGGTTHAGTLFGNSCVDDQIAAYLADGTLPARKPGNGPDTLCDPLPQPVPAGAASVSVSTLAQTLSQTQSQSQSAAAKARRQALLRLIH